MVARRTHIPSNPDLISEFRAYPEKGVRPHWWVQVSVFRSKRAMYEYAINRYQAEAPSFRAAFFYRDASNKYRSRTQLGEIVLQLREITHELVVHECTHAALCWWRVVTKMPAEIGEMVAINNEERFVLNLGIFVNAVEEQIAKIRPKSDVD